MGNPNDSQVQAKKRRKYQRVTRKPEVQDAVHKPRIDPAVATLGASRAGALRRAENAGCGENGGQSDLAFDARGLFEGGTVEAQAELLQRLDGMQRQRAVQRIARVQGNQHVQRLVAAYGGNGNRRVSPPVAVQTKLEVGESDDVYEREADAVAETVMRSPALVVPPPEEGPPGEGGGNGASSFASTIDRSPSDDSRITAKSNGVVQTKLEVGEPGDEYEQEADAVADQVMRMSSAAPPPPPGEEDDGGNGSSSHTSVVPYEEIQASGDVVSTVTPEVETSIQSMKGTGAPLPSTERSYFEERFGADFGGVRVHTGDTAAQTAQDLSARAYTVGSDIAFGSGEYAPGSEHGRRLMAHELTHVVQQGGAGALQREPEGTIRRSEEEEPSGGGGETAAPPVPAEGGGPAEPAGEGEGGAPQPGGNGAEPRGAITPTAPAISDQGTGDNGAGAQVAEALAVGSKAPSSPGEDPGFQAVTGRVDSVAEQEQTHEEPETEAEEAQEAAEPPTNEVESQAQDQQVQEMEQQEPGEFSAAAFKAALLAKIKGITPKKLKDVDEFKKKNRISSVKQDIDQKIADQKQRAIGPLEEKVVETPDTSEIEPKPVTPMSQPDIGPPPPDVGAQEAAPKPKTTDEIEAPLQQESQSLDREFDEAGITEQQLAESNEPGFLAALDAKKQAQAYAQESPQGYRQQEAQIVTGAEQEAQTAVEAPLDGMHSSREDLLGAVFSDQYDTKAADEGKRGEVATAINEIYEATKTDVEASLEALSPEVEKMFDTAADKARKLFEDYVDKRMKAYKKKRYKGFFGKLKWLKDKLFGMPKEVNKFYEEGRQMYIDTMDVALDGIAEHVATKLNETMARIAKGRQEIQEYVESLPEDLQQIGSEAANEIQTKFDDLEQDVKDKQTELIDTLASKYQENLQELDARIEELKAANRGLIAKAIDFIKNVIATVVQLAAMLVKILMKAAAAVPKIILNPIGFLKNLLKGVKQGLRNFVKNIGQHLQSAVLEWLTGATGLQLPSTLDAKGLFDLVLQVLGLTYANIRERAVNIFGEKTVAYLEKGFEVFKILVTEGPAGLWEYIKDKVGDLKAMVIDRIKDLIKTKIIKAGIEWIVSMLGGPAGAFIKAVKAIIKVVKWFLENAKKIMALIDAVLDAILAIASGSVDAAANKIEEALARQIPVVLSFLADLVGVGDLSGSVRKIITEVRKPINSAIDWVLKKVKEFVIKMGHKLGIGVEDEAEEDKEARLQEALLEARDVVDAKFAGKEVDKKALDSAVGSELKEIQDDRGLTELETRAGRDTWDVYGKVNPEEEVATKAKLPEGRFVIEASPNGTAEVDSTVKYTVVQAKSTQESANNRYRFQWSVENDPTTAPELKQHVVISGDKRGCTLRAKWPGIHRVKVDVFLDDTFIEGVVFEQKVVFDRETAADPVVAEAEKVIEYLQQYLKAGGDYLSAAQVDILVRLGNQLMRAVEAYLETRTIGGLEKSSFKFAGVWIAATGVLVADDTTGVGVADDIAIPFTLLLAGLAALVGVLAPSPTPVDVLEDARDRIKDIARRLEKELEKVKPIPIPRTKTRRKNGRYPLIWPHLGGKGLAINAPNPAHSIHVNKQLVRTVPQPRNAALVELFKATSTVLTGQAVHHVTPLFLGGPDSLGNLAAVWISYHVAGHAALLQQYHLTALGLSPNPINHPPGTPYYVAQIV